MGDDQTRTLDEAAASIRAMLGVTDDDRNAEYRRNIRNAQNDASVCAKCSRKIAASEPVWRQRFDLGYGLFGGGWGTTVAPVCSSCKDEHELFDDAAKPCAGCGRPVHNLTYSVYYRRFTFCSEVCRPKALAAYGRNRRCEARGDRPCEGCGETFKPTRTDARFCSVACKQRAYRQRVTDDVCVTGDGHKKRNAKAATPTRSKAVTRQGGPKADARAAALVWEDCGNTRDGACFDAHAGSSKYALRPTYSFPDMKFTGYDVEYIRKPNAENFKDRERQSIANGVRTADEAKAIAQKHYDEQQKGGTHA
jgi:hypothetical protein